MSEQSERQITSLRERKKAKTRAAIQIHALRLFRQQGYEATTVEQIVDLAEVSETTFFRYFPTKGDVVLWDAYDPVIMNSFRDQPLELSSIEALRRALQSAFSQWTAEAKAEQRERMSLVFAVPELRAAMLDKFASGMGFFAEIIAERAGRAADDLAVRTLAGAAVGAMMAAMFAIPHDANADFATLVDEVMTYLAAGPAL